MASPFTVRLIQNSFTHGAFLVSLNTSGNSPIVCQKYDIRVVDDNEFSDIGKDAIATNTVIKDFTITSTPLSLAIPIDATTMVSKQKYKVTIRLYSSTVTYSHTTPADNMLYYDTHVYTVKPVSVASIPSGNSSKFVITDVALRRDSTALASNELASNDSFFNDVGVSAVVMSATALSVSNVSNTSFKTGDDYYLGSASFVFDASYNFGITGGMKDELTDKPASAYELWGYLSLGPQFTFGINIVANDSTIGYVIDNPDIDINLGDVIGDVSDYPIAITLNNWNHYKNSDYMFTSLELEIYDASGTTLLKRTDASGNYTAFSNDFITSNDKQVIRFTKTELQGETDEKPLRNGVDYTFKTILHFKQDSLYKPELNRYATKVGRFLDVILPIVSGSAVNSWQIDTSKGAGLVVSFKKTDQFYGRSSTIRPYNLEGNTTVKAEYSTFDVSGNQGAWSDWKDLSGGTITQSTANANYALNSANTNGVYSIPVYNDDEKRGSDQDNVHIYAVIPDKQDKYSAVQIRLSLITDLSNVFSKTTSDNYEVPRVDGTTYKNNQVVDNKVTFRYHAKPVAHDFATDKPICTSAGASISFDVPLTVPPFYMAVVTTSDGDCSGNVVTNIINPNIYDANNALLWNKPVARTGSGLNYTPVANTTFKLNVKYVSIENPVATSESEVRSMTVQRQGFPSSSFSITSNSCRWNKSTQQIDYALAISATSTSADRIDGWNMYTSATDASGNLLSEASGNLSRDASGNLLSDAYGNVYTLQQYNKLISGGLTQSVTLANVDYPDYKNIAVTFVATRSLYLNPANFDKQVETIGAGLGDTRQALVTKLPDVLPRINTSDITLENTVYNVVVDTVHNTFATLKANRPSNANGLRIKNTDSNTSAVDISGNVFDISYNIPLSNSTLERSYDIRARYYSIDTPDPTNVDSLPVTVTFINSISNRIAPNITTGSKEYNSNKSFTVKYTSANSGSWLNTNSNDLNRLNTEKDSNVYVKYVTDARLVGVDDGSVDISGNFGFNGKNVDMYVKDTFTTTYKVTPEVTEAGIATVNGTNKTSIQNIDSPSSDAFYLAANPQIDESSIIVDGTNNFITVNVKNMGTPVLNSALLVVSQDSTINEGDKGYNGAAYFNNSNSTGFTSSVVETTQLTISGNAQALQTLSITENKGTTDMDTVTKLTFSSITLANTNPVNVSLFVRNTIEGSDSCAVANKAIVYPYAAPVLSGSVAYAAGYTATATYTFNTNVSAIKVMKSDGTTIIASQAVSSGTASLVIPYTDADISGAKSFYVVALGNSFAPESMASASQLLISPPPPLPAIFNAGTVSVNTLTKQSEFAADSSNKNLAFDAAGNIWVGAYNSAAQYTASGVSLNKSFGGGGGHAIDGYGNIWVSDPGWNSVRKINGLTLVVLVELKTGTYTLNGVVQATQNGNYSFAYPGSIAIDMQGNVYVLDGGNKRVQKFTKDGLYISTIISNTGNNQRGMTVSKDGSIYVLHSSGGYLSKYNSAGVAVYNAITPGGRNSITTDKEGNPWLTGSTSFFQYSQSDGSVLREITNTGQLNNPGGIAISSTGKIYVSATGKVQIWG